MRQKIRKALIIFSLLLFPVTLYYFSPALIINAAFEGIVNGSFIVFLLMFILSIPFGRLFCGYLCPAGGLQECASAVNGKIPKQGFRNYIKYVIWIIWIALVLYCYFSKGEIAGVDFLYETNKGISVSDAHSYIIYYGIVMLIFIPSILLGKRVFCHYFCWMAPFMIFGTKLRKLLHLPGLHIKIKNEKACTSCGQCSRNCPMGIKVSEQIAKGRINSAECIQCGACIDSCKKKVLSYGMTERKK